MENEYINNLICRCCEEIKGKDVATVYDIKNALRLEIININDEGDFIILTNIYNGK